MDSSPQPHYPGDDISLRAYVERMIADLSASMHQRIMDLELRLEQRYQAQKEGIATAMTASEKAVTAAMAASEKAVDKAEQAQALRNQVANEFRDTIADTNALMWPSKEGMAAVSSLDAKLTEGMDSMRREWAARFEGLDARLKTVETNAARGEGRGIGSAAAVGYLFAGVAMVAAIVALMQRLGG